MTTASPPPAPDTAAWPPLDAHRANAGRALVQWAAAADDSLPRLCLLRGARASGKSHLLAWFLVGAATHPRTTAHATVPSEGLTTDALSWEMSRQLGYGPLPPHRLLDRVATDQRPLLLVVPDLHLAGRGPSGRPSAQPETIVEELLNPLLEFPYVRLVAETGTTELLSTSNAGPHLIDLGAAPYPGTSQDPQRADFTTLAAALPRTTDGRPIWDQAPHTSREHILDAALEFEDGDEYEYGDGDEGAEVKGDGSAVRTLLADPGFLIHGSTTAITAALHSPTTLAPTGLRTIWNRAAPQLSGSEHSDTARAALLHAAALTTSPTLSEYLRPLAEQHQWTAMWAQHDTPVTAHCPIPATGGQLLASDPLGRLHRHDPATGARTGTLPSPTAIRPSGIAAAGPDAVLILDETGALHSLTADADADADADEDEGESEGKGKEGAVGTVLGHITSHHGAIQPGTDASADNSSRPTALGSCAESGLVAVGDTGGAVHMWSLTEYWPMPRSRRLHTVPVTAVTCLRLPDDDLTFVISAAFDGSVRLWETSQEPMESPVEQRPALVTALAAADTPAGPLIAAAWNDAELHLWHLTSGKLRTLPLLHRCSALSLSATGHLTIGGPDGLHTVRLDFTRLWG
ncbi:hypothetical protein ACFY12_04140 [Streptomyces sp. NPDC001339]|uniref:hypothetical protein n=1 Tax=Streptomyces sp. NPDC001339 TaxID=3364563 RepID=UPI0036BC691B